MNKMKSISSLASKRLRVETCNNAENGSTTEDVITESASGGPESGLTISGDADTVVESVVNIFTDDILPQILDNMEILTAQDLLNFRLVNRCWRDAATSVILKRNLCEIKLGFGKVVTDADGNSVCEKVGITDWRFEYAKEQLGYPPATYKYFSVNQPKSVLADLSQLISSSLKCPFTSLNFYSDCGWVRTFLKSDGADPAQHQTDLLHFFSLYGQKIRKLTLNREISEKAAKNLLYVHLPHLVCLDIKKLSDFMPENQGQNKSHSLEAPLPPQPTLGIKEILVGSSDIFTGEKIKFLKEIIAICPNLNAIHNVGEAGLGPVLELGKSHLIQDLSYGYRYRQWKAITGFTELLTENILKDKHPNIQLSKCNVYLTNFKRYCHVWKAINVILCASKDSLKCLKMSMSQSRDLLHYFFPPLPRLESITMIDYMGGSTARHQFHFVGDVIGQAVEFGELTPHGEVVGEDFDELALQSQESSNIPMEYFPRLRKVKIISGKQENDSTKLMGFFSLEHLGPDGVTIVPGDIILTVTTLKFNIFPCHNRNISKLFPNVSHLSIYCDSSSQLQNWVWTAFPKLKIFELSTLHLEWDADAVDCFFTGISQESCTDDDSDASSSSEADNSDPEQDFIRTQPYIGD